MWEAIQKPLQIVLTLLGLSGLVDSIVEWHGFVGGMVYHYTIIRDLVFGYLPFSISDFWKDYLIVGVALFPSYYGSLYSYLDERMREDEAKHLDAEHVPVWIQKVTFLVAHALTICLWPLLIAMFIVVLPAVRSKFEPSSENERIYTEKALNFGRMVGQTVFFFLGALFVASDALSKLTGG